MRSKDIIIRELRDYVKNYYRIEFHDFRFSLWSEINLLAFILDDDLSLELQTLIDDVNKDFHNKEN